MDAIKATEILEALASGVSPVTGEVLHDESVLYDRDVIRALQFAIDRMESYNKRKTSKPKGKAKDDYSIVDYFRREKFNNFSESYLKKLSAKVSKLKLLKAENLSPFIQAARKTYPRAYEPWLDAEKSLFADAIEFTNDLEVLSRLFQRGRGSVQFFGEKLIYEREHGELPIE